MNRHLSMAIAVLLWPVLSSAAVQKPPQARPAPSAYRDVNYVPPKPRPKSLPAPAPSNQYAAPRGEQGKPWEAI
jgi:hypothetical protein